MHPAWFPAALLAAILASTLPASTARAAELYATDFENFTAGENNWAGTDGWSDNLDIDSGSQGIDLDAIPGGGLGKTAYLGFRQPQKSTVVLTRDISHDPAATGIPIVEFQVLLGIEDSTNGRYDSFFLQFFNQEGFVLGGLGFLNSQPDLPVTRTDGVSRTLPLRTGLSFIHGELHLVAGRINLVANTWSASVDGYPLFENQPFNGNGQDRKLGSLAFQWRLSSSLTTSFGNNWLLVADIVVRSAPVGSEPFLLDAFSRNPVSGAATLAWTGEPGFDYRVEYGDGLGAWQADLPASLFTGGSAPGPMQFTDTPPPATRRRFYRVLRGESP
jgi:hypothetical protein